MPSISSVRELRQKRAEIYDRVKGIVDKAESEKRELTAEELSNRDLAFKDMDALKVQIDADEKLIGYENEMRNIPAGKPVINPDEQVADPGKKSDLRSAFVTYLRSGEQGLTPEESKLLKESRAFSTGTNAGGGYTVATAFLARLEEALKYYGPMMRLGEIIRTDSGASLSLPTVNDTGNVGAILAENTAATADATTPFGQTSIAVYMYSSNLLAVSMELLQDSAFDIEGTVARLLGERLGRILNTHFTTGDGSSKPYGVMAEATLGKTGTTGQTTSVIYDDLVDLIHAVDPAYRAMGNLRFMMADSSLKVVRKLKDGQSRPLWEPSVQAGKPDMLLGYPVEINNDVAAMAASAKSIAFGDFSKYKIRSVSDVQVLRLGERLIDYLQIGFLGWGRFGGRLLDAGTHPVVYYANSAT